MKISRKQFLVGAAGSVTAALSAAGYTCHWEPNWFEVTQKNVGIKHLKQPIKLLHLSDLHASDAVPYELIEEAIDLAIQQQADLACLTGDFITSKLYQPGRYAAILKKLSNAMPCFACIGNHDGGSWAGRTYGYPDCSAVRDLLRRSDIEVLFNAKQNITIQGQALSIIGLGDIWSQDSRPELVMDSKRWNAKPVILLSHNPDSKESLAGYIWDLMLAGHTHGGQLIVPILGTRPFLPIRDKRFAEGLHPWKGHQIHVTRGVGNLHGMRINCRPEISVLNLLPLGDA